MKRTPLLSLAAVCLLAQCNKAPQAAAPVASATPAAPSVPLITSHASPYFMKVASHLEVGGSSFNYADKAGLMEAIAMMLDDAIKNLPPEQRKEMPTSFSFVKLFQDFGLDNVKALGSSSRRMDSGLYHSRSFALTPHGRKGLMTLNGGPAEPFMILQAAPKGTDLALEIPLHLKSVAKDSLASFIAMMPEQGRANVEAPLNEPVPMLGITTRELIEKLDARLGLFIQVYPDQQLPLPGAEVPVPGLDALLVADRLGWLLEPLKQQFLPMLSNPAIPVEVVDKDGVLTITFKTAVGPAPMDFQPMLRFDSKADRLMLATRASFLKKALEGKELLTTDAEFKTAWTGMPEEGNAAVYLSPVLLKTLQSLARQGMEVSTEPQSMKDIVNKGLDFLTPYLGHGQAACMANLPDGTLGLANLAIPMSDTSVLTSITTLSILSSLAVPTFNLISVKANQQKASAQGRDIVLALRAYAAENNGALPPTLSDLPNGAELLNREGGTPVWLYNATLTADAPSTAIVLATEAYAGKTRCVVRMDGSAEVIKEVQFEVESDENLIQR